ncbi:hypothetical protein Leryth_010828 [Lithospermum erythrorhizon]|nr:hypothetical protein Leryth_010828 [Lithospermum erythrorhizon]
MAVQAQYPSNVLLFNRNTQEGKNTIGNDYSIQQPKGGGGEAAPALFDNQQPHILFNPGVKNNNTRKRSRELISSINNSGPLMTLQQSQYSNQVMDLSQLHTPQNHLNNVVSTGLQLAFGDQFQQHKHHPLHHQTQEQKLSLLSSQSSQKSSVFLPFLSDDLDGEQLRLALLEKRQMSFKTLLAKAEGSISRRLREMDVEAEKAFRRNVELEAHAAQLSAASHAWQARAREHEVTMSMLQAQLQQAMLNSSHAIMGIGGVERGEGGCGGECEGVAAVEDEESAYIDPDRVVELGGTGCKTCGRRVASMVLLPCRHLCLCRECDSVTRCCPVCYCFRNYSVEVIMN